MNIGINDKLHIENFILISDLHVQDRFCRIFFLKHNEKRQEDGRTDRFEQGGRLLHREWNLKGIFVKEPDGGAGDAVGRI